MTGKGVNNKGNAWTLCDLLLIMQLVMEWQSCDTIMLLIVELFIQILICSSSWSCLYITQLHSLPVMYSYIQTLPCGFIRCAPDDFGIYIHMEMEALDTN